VRTPKNFECDIRVREGREGVVESEFAEARVALGKYEG
jgi:hypothetical protein